MTYAQGFNVLAGCCRSKAGRWVAIVLVFVLPDQCAVGQTVPDFQDELGADPEPFIRLLRSREDSLKLMLIDIEIAHAELEAAATNFWHRLIPDIRVSANFGVQQLAFVDPTTFTPYKLPKDSYRLTLSLSLSDIWNSKQHEQALLVLDRLRIKKRELEQKLDTDKHRLLRHRAALQKELDFRLEELSLLQQSLKYTQLLFEEGKADFNALVRAKRQVLNVEKSISMTRTRQAGAETE